MPYRLIGCALCCSRASAVFQVACTPFWAPWRAKLNGVDCLSFAGTNVWYGPEIPASFMTTVVVTKAYTVTGKIEGSEWNARSTCKQRLKLARTGQPSSLDLSFRLSRW